MPVRHVLSAGECLQSLALTFGFKDGKHIFDAPENAELRKKRRSPAEVAPGDAVVVPDPKPRELSLATGNVHQVTVSVPAVVLRVQVRDEAGEPLAGKPYELAIDGKKLEGTTTGDGVVEQPVPVQASAATLLVHESEAKAQGRWSWVLKLASLEAPETRTGAWQRLANLGYWSASEAPDQAEAGEAPPDAASRDPLVLAIRAFQHEEKLEESGRIDDATRARLVERHGI